MKLWGAVLLTAVLGLSGCGPRTKTPAELLPGTWFGQIDRFESTLTFAPDGTYRWQIKDPSLMGRLTGFDLTVPGR
ncbi:MAG: hypothetical protein SH850_10910 [Planctomycetaceae bacterium]|nr:hypothetical protein [Planctomycetaceae bacterium]